MFEFFKKHFKKNVVYKEECTSKEIVKEYLTSDLSISLHPFQSEIAYETLKEVMLVMINTCDGTYADKTINPSKRRSLIIWGYQLDHELMPNPPDHIDIITTEEINRIMPRQKLEKAFKPYTKLMNAKKYFFIVHFPGARVFLERKDGVDRLYQYEREAVVFLEMLKASMAIKKTKTVIFIDILKKEKKFLKATSAPGMEPGKLIDVTDTFRKITKKSNKRSLV